MKRNTSGVYAVVHRPSGRYYVGASYNVSARRSDHWRRLSRGNHYNEGLQAAWNSDGPDAFEFRVLELVSVPELLQEREAYFVAEAKARGLAFNMIKVGALSLNMRRAAIGKHREHLLKVRVDPTGQKRSDDTRRRIGESQRGVPKSPELCAKMSAAAKRRLERDPQHLVRARALTAWDLKSEDEQATIRTHLLAIRVDQTGMKRSLESRARMSVSAKRRCERARLLKAQQAA